MPRVLRGPGPLRLVPETPASVPHRNATWRQKLPRDDDSWLAMRNTRGRLLGLLILLSILFTYVRPTSLAGEAFFEDRSSLLTDNPSQKFYGISITDVNGDGQLDAFVTGNAARNMVYTWNPATRNFINIATPILEDASRAVRCMLSPNRTSV